MPATAKKFDGSGVPRVYDNGDGTYTPASYNEGAGGGAGGGGGGSADPTIPGSATTAAYAASLVVKNAAGTLFGVSGYNSKSTGQFVQFHDAASVPADNAAPKVVVYVAAQSAWSVDFGERGRAFAAGIVICNSSTGPTKTIGSADMWIDAQYI